MCVCDGGGKISGVKKLQCRFQYRERGREIKRVREGVRERERVMIEGEKYIKREKGCCVSINARRP